MNGDDLHLKDKTVSDLLEMRDHVRKFGYNEIAQEITRELNSRGYFDVPRLCSCREIQGDDPACPVHGGAR